ncbi:hypothetical protein PPH41_20580 [Burkholderia gladioli]|nr:hypothetical protein [Burkholderia gladioli]
MLFDMAAAPLTGEFKPGFGAGTGTTRHDTTRHDTTRHDTTRHDTTRQRAGSGIS